MRRWIAAVVLAVSVCGCGKREPTPAAGVTVLAPGGGKLVYQEITDPRRVRESDNLQVTVDVVQVNAPAGSLSGKASLWQIASGEFTPELSRLLENNGIRTGVMSSEQWDEVREVLLSAPDVVSQTATIAGKSRSSLNVRKVMQETLFYFDRQWQLQGRTYENAENFWGVHFAPDPARPGHVSLELAPVIRSVRRQMRLNRTGDDYNLEFEQPETVLDLAIKTSLPVGSVLVIAPTGAAFNTSTNVGRAFLTTEQEGGLTEQLLFLYPRLYRLTRTEQ